MRKLLLLFVLVLAGCSSGIKKSEYPMDVFHKQVEATDLELEYDSKGLIVPLYLYPGDDRQQEFERIATMKLSYPDLPIIVIINPHNGPGVFDENYDELIKVYEVLGITTVGYIYADYSNRPLEIVYEEIDQYRELYPELDGLFIDEVDDENNFDYYNAILEYANDLDFLIGNPGTEVSVEYYDIFNIMIIAEKNYSNLEAEFFNKDSFQQVAPFQKGVIVHHADEVESLYLLDYANWIYTTEFDTYRKLTNKFEEITELIMEENEG